LLATGGGPRGRRGGRRRAADQHHNERDAHQPACLPLLHGDPPVQMRASSGRRYGGAPSWWPGRLPLRDCSKRWEKCTADGARRAGREARSLGAGGKPRQDVVAAGLALSV